MDLSTIIGALIGFLLILWGVIDGNILTILLNGHGLVIVLGGTFAAILISTPLKYLKEGFLQIFMIFKMPQRQDPDEMIKRMRQLAEKARLEGVLSLTVSEEDQAIANGFLARAVEITREKTKPSFLRSVLEEEIYQQATHAKEIINIFRTMAILSPMFGLLGTLIGIIQVLRELSNPEMVGPSMALAITSAFYGILFSNLIFIPVAGKLRIRNLEEIREKEMILEGMVEILRGSIPLVVVRKLSSFRNIAQKSQVEKVD